ncbi:MAG: ammonium transporter, partial [Dehalococcoidia bacterium]|nr:ammonium transporter [Dehalococcoidia bacterium]
ISGAFAERKKFSAFVLFSLAWSTFIYSPLAHWVWGGGWLFERGALDFAGGTVVHLSSGVSALVCAIVLGKRTGFGKDEMEPHNVPYTILGAALLWFGWFGFNAGSALGANGQAAMAFLVTNIAGAAGGLGWLGYSWIVKGKPSVVGGVAGAVAGLVAITPAAGFVDPLAAIAIGLIGGILSGFAVDLLKKNFGVDDALDVFA